jgi:hypothetical protein
MKRLCHSLLALLLCAAPVLAELSDAELDKVGRKVWQNESAGKRDGLTAWNAGENFPSLGIGHFIWYPKGVNGPFEESFPKLLEFFQQNGVKLPGWLKPGMDAPWSSRAEFQKEFRSGRTNELRDLLADTIRLQSRFLAQRMREALPKMLAEASASQRTHVRKQFDRLAATGAGTFALIDYVNFKGEGTNKAERYNGEGWGLLQVLAKMEDGGSATGAFSKSATEVLTRRVKNSPPARGEERWLAGWKNRVRAYAE